MAATEPTVTALLRAYDATLQQARELPMFVIVPTTYRSHGEYRFIRRIPRPRWFLRFFVVDHVHYSLDVVRRRLLVKAALGDATEQDDADRLAVEQYVQSLPAHRRRTYVATLVTLTIVITQLVLVETPQAARVLGGRSLMGRADFIRRMLEGLAATTGNISSLDEFLDAVTTTPLTVTLFLVTSIATVLYVELRLLVPAFRLKRMLCNLSPDLDRLQATRAGWSTQRATGLYERERAAFARLDAPTVIEMPFDLIVSALALPALLYAAVMTIQAGFGDPIPGSDPELSLLLGSAIAAGVVARAGWLVQVWRRRTRGGDEPPLPYEARIERTDLVVKLRDPRTVLAFTTAAGLFCLGIGLATETVSGDVSAIRFFTLLFVVAPLWYRMNREVSAYLRARHARRPGWPVLSLMAMAVGWVGDRRFTAAIPVASGLVLVSVYRTCRRIRRAESFAGIPRSQLLSPWLVTAGSLLFPLVLAHLQAALNGIWRQEGTRITPVPDDTGVTATPVPTG